VTRSRLVKNDGSDPIVGTFTGLPEGAVIPISWVADWLPPSRTSAVTAMMWLGIW
jgi:hypothetical protein